MKAKKRVVTSGKGGGRGPATGRPTRTPTVRRVKSAIVPARPVGPAAATRPGADPGRTGPGGTVSVEPVVRTADRAAEAVDLSVDLAPKHGGLRLGNPVLVASGTFGYGIEYGDVVDVERLGVAKLGRKRGGGKPDPVGSPAARRKSFLQVALEQNMGCAVGACLGCVVMGANGQPQRVCREGPVFASDEIAWEGGW